MFSKYRYCEGLKNKCGNPKNNKNRPNGQK